MKSRMFYNRGIKICRKIQNATTRHNARIMAGGGKKKKMCTRQRFKRKIRLILQFAKKEKSQEQKGKKL